MKIKSLLIGSAAAIVAAPAAFAADVIIAEPEPVEYVEVCDVAGAGYFYIPGSRTCIQFSGLVRHELTFSEFAFVRLDAAGNEVLDSDFQDGWNSLVRGELNIRTFTETELGDLTSFIRFRANDFNQDPLNVVVNQQGGQLNIQGLSINGSTFLNNATIGLGGLLIGMSDTLYDGGINGEFDQLGGDRVHFVRYTADFGAFSAAIAAELERRDYSRNDFVPNIVGQLSGDLGAFAVDLWAAYDDDDDLVNLDDEFSLKARVGADFGPATIQAAATYNSGSNYYDNGYEYSVGASAKFGLGEKASFTFGGQYFANALNGSASPVDDLDAFRIGANVDYEIVDGFDMKIAVNYVDAETFLVQANGNVIDDSEGLFGGFIRFDRSF